MGVIIGIDVGGSTTKIVGFRQETGALLPPQFVRATDPVTSVYGAFGKFTSENGLSIPDIGDIFVTGVGASYINGAIYSLPCHTVTEFSSIGLGGLYTSSLSRAVVVSMGTGTALVYAKRGQEPVYLGGTGLGGGTIVGLAKKMLNIEVIDHLQELAETGSLANVDLRVGDISDPRSNAALNPEMTAANFGRVSDMASKSDIALGIFNMVYETVARVAMFAAHEYDCRDIVLTGQLATMRYAHRMFSRISEMFGINFIIPEYARFATVIGTALAGMRAEGAVDVPAVNQSKNLSL